MLLQTIFETTPKLKFWYNSKFVLLKHLKKKQIIKISYRLLFIDYIYAIMSTAEKPIICHQLYTSVSGIYNEQSNVSFHS